MTSTISTFNDNGANGTSSNKTFKFGVSNFLGEPAEGEWTLSIRDAADGNSGTLGGWRMTIYGH
jgi:subtilisin-like proprotein convertase family protein